MSERARTPISDSDVRDLIISCHTDLFGKPPTRLRLMILWSVLAFEHGAGDDTNAPANGRACWNLFDWNFGNRRGGSGDAGSYQQSAPEIIDGKTKDVGGNWPAFTTRERGMASWLLMMSIRFNLSWIASLSGNVLAYSVAAKLQRYFTDPVAHYAEGVRTWARIYSARDPRSLYP